MANLAFFRTQDGPVEAFEFIASQPLSFQNALKIAVQELIATGQITHGRCARVSGTDWSLWIEDPTGERHNFILYVSELEEARQPRPSPSSKELGIYQGVPGLPSRAQEWTWIEASELIRSGFEGYVRDTLLEKLKQALQGIGAQDDSIEFVRDGVILRAPSKDHQVRLFDAEIKLQWKDAF